MRSPEFPAAGPAAEDREREHLEAFLEHDRHALNQSLATVFDFLDELPEEESASLLHGHQERQDAELAGDRGLAFRSVYGERMLAVALDKKKKTPEEQKPLLAEYKEFLLALSYPELRAQLLSKMCYLDAGETEEEQVETWPERRAFHRFLYEFYGSEKKTAVFESGDRKGEKMELFLSLEGQADFFEACNIKMKWGFSEKAFDDIRNEIPAMRERLKGYEDQPLVAPVLTPFLPDLKNEQGEIVQNGVPRTFTALRKLMAAGQKSMLSWDTYTNPTEANLRLLEDVTHTPGLKLEIIDFGAYKDEAPEDVRNAHSPHAQVLALLASSSRWIPAMDGKEVPFVWVPGYEVTQRTFNEWSWMPYVWRDGASAELSGGTVSHRFLGFAFPVLRK